MCHMLSPRSLRHHIVLLDALAARCKYLSLSQIKNGQAFLSCGSLLLRAWLVWVTLDAVTSLRSGRKTEIPDQSNENEIPSGAIWVNCLLPFWDQVFNVLTGQRTA